MAKARPAQDPAHERLLAIVKSLPGTEEDWPWGSIHCKVAGKIFVGWGRHDDGTMSMGFRTSLALQSVLVESDPRFSIAKYSGKYGGVDMRLDAKPDWAEVEEFIVESYRIIAPKKLVKELDARRATTGEAAAVSARRLPRAGRAGPRAAKPAPAATRRPTKRRSG